MFILNNKSQSANELIKESKIEYESEMFIKFKESIL